MSCDVLINILDDHNEGSILATAKYKPKEVIFIYLENCNIEDQVEKLSEYYLNKFPFTTFIPKKINHNDFSKVEDIIKSYSNKNTIINLTGGKKFICLIIEYFARKNGIKVIYLDIEQEKLITFNDKNIEVMQDDFLNLDVDDVIESIGGAIVVDSTEECSKKAVEEFTNMIAKNISLWEKYKYRIYDNRIFIHDQSNPSMIKINMSCLNKQETDIYYKILNMLSNYDQIKYWKEDNFIKIRFLNLYMKSFIFKSGSWLEVFTKRVVEEIEAVDDVKSGVLFLWNDDKRRVRNELDVVAVKDSVLICISCKDSAKYDEVALNELNVYGNQLGGESVIKILVATKPPIKSSVLDRAREMNIWIVLFNGDRKEFKDKLKKIITRKYM
ncbi:hypothetical protein CPJCM30710_20210 [Clostridium polyendosporum]|uniref:Card1 endonuclease domain-containing protein n=1 Tax=Clostridium polyendosporum TaxID=69208 RepID=A0A919VGG2_9CLOT|nr:DUF1887 family CARF protein [Clostridium polyendosporum]GIM29355.1 hypothetical protein CPJCM30710_20210 [Clostridium polyendosporum]